MTAGRTGRNDRRRERSRRRTVLVATSALALGAALALAPAGSGPSVAADDWVLDGDDCGVVQSVLVPPGVRSVTVEAVGGWGGLGGTGQGGATAYGTEGFSAKVVAGFAVTPGQTIRAVVGCGGRYGGFFDNSGTTPGWSSGGGAGRGNTVAGSPGASGGAGGGSTGVCLGTGPCSPSGTTTVVVAGGGGGGPTYNCAGMSGVYGGGSAGYGTYSSAGGGGGPSGEAGDTGNGVGGSGGINSAGGSPHGATGADGSGWSGVNVVGGGGGGGYVGGQAGGHYDDPSCRVGGGGGGGSSWVSDSATSRSFLSDVIYLSGVRVTFSEPVFDATSTDLTASPSPSDEGESVTFTARVTSGGSAVTTGAVDFTVDGAVVAVGVAVDGTGRARFDTAALAPGPHAVAAAFMATGTHAGSSGSLTHQVVEVPDATTTTVDGPAEATVYGDVAAFTVGVRADGSPVASGSVEVLVDGASQGTWAVDASGEVPWSSDALGAGTHTVQARYLGDAHHAASEGDRDHQVLPTPTVVSVAPVPDPGRAVGDGPDFDATVTTAAGGAVTGGAVEVTAGSVVLGSALPLSPEGRVRFSTAALPAGDHVVVVSYGGDADHQPSETSLSTRSRSFRVRWTRRPRPRPRPVRPPRRVRPVPRAGPAPCSRPPRRAPPWAASGLCPGPAPIPGAWPPWAGRSCRPERSWPCSPCAVGGSGPEPPAPAPRSRPVSCLDG